MAMGKPVIATATPGLVDYVQDGNTGEPRMATAPPDRSVSRRRSAPFSSTGNGANVSPGRTAFRGRTHDLDNYVAAVSRTVQEALLAR
jgi:glycosyltransferase involved in cell wall biosynthesis